MTTVAELIEYLKKLPPETEVRVVEVDNYEYSICSSFKPLDLANNVNYVDLTGNLNVEEDSPLFGRKFLDLGEVR